MLEKADSDLVRRRNRGLVLAAMRHHAPAARVQLGQLTGLSPASITSITSQMLVEGLIVPAGLTETPLRGTRGRPQTQLTINPAAALAVAVSISVDGVVFALADFSGCIINHTRLSLEIFDHSETEFAALLAHHITEFALQAGYPLTAVARIGIAVQGVANTQSGEIAWSPAFKTRNISIVEPLQNLLGIPCSIANNANQIAQALLNRDSTRYGTATAVVFLGHGIGLGLVLNGAVFEGATGRASELGHIRHDPGKGETDERLPPLCRCGMTGCIEAYSADYGIYRSAKVHHAAFDLYAPVPHDVMSLLRQRAENGDREAMAAFRRAGTALGCGLARLIALINPELLVFAGPGTAHFRLMKRAIHDAIADQLVEDLYGNVKFEVLEPDEDLILSGTVMEMLSHLDHHVFAEAGPVRLQDA